MDLLQLAVTWYMLEGKLPTGTSKTKKIQIYLDEVALFWMSQKAACPPECTTWPLAASPLARLNQNSVDSKLKNKLMCNPHGYAILTRSVGQAADEQLNKNELSQLKQLRLVIIKNLGFQGH